MSMQKVQPIQQRLLEAIGKIDRPGSFCTSGSTVTVLPGLEVEGMGTVALPLSDREAKELKQHCEQAPYGKGEETLVDTNVRRVWRMTPEHFQLINPEWPMFVEGIVARVQSDLGLEKQELQAHLYDLLLYEPGSFFLPHQDGEKLDRMVATLVIVLPSKFEGGELVVRHDGDEQTIDFAAEADTAYRIRFAAFYADCEHEIRPLREGHRLCLIYNLTLANAKKELTAPRRSEHVDELTTILRDWSKRDDARRIVFMLGHQYTQNGLTWDALKGTDRAQATILRDAAIAADCESYLALLTFHESGSAEGGYDNYYGGGYRSRHQDNFDDFDDADEGFEGEDYLEDEGEYEMGEVFESDLNATQWIDPENAPSPIPEMGINEEDLLQPNMVRTGKPEEDFEGYTGNAGMTLDRWYRHAAVIIWPRRKRFDVLCDCGINNIVPVLDEMISRWKQLKGTEAETLKKECVEFAKAIIMNWPERPHTYRHERTTTDPLLPLIAPLDDVQLIRDYISRVLGRDAAIEPDKTLMKAFEHHGWKSLSQELVAVFKGTTASTLERNSRILEQCCTYKSDDQDWRDLCDQLGSVLIAIIEEFDENKRSSDWRLRDVKRAELLTTVVKSLSATGQEELLARFVDHVLSHPKIYPLREAQVSAIKDLEGWLRVRVKTASPALSKWLDACRVELESLTAKEPKEPTDFRRGSEVGCHCKECGELKRFLANPKEEVHRFPAVETRRRHLEECIQSKQLDVDFKTEKRGRPYTLVCTKNKATYERKLGIYHEDLERLAMIRSIEKRLPT